MISLYNLDINTLSHYQIYHLQIFLLFGSLPCWWFFLVWFLLYKSFQFNFLPFVYFCFHFLCFRRQSEQILIQFMSKSVLPMFSSSFMVSHLIFRSLIHFEFIFVYGVRECSNFILLHVAVQFCRLHLQKRLSFLHCISLLHLS